MIVTFKGEERVLDTGGLEDCWSHLELAQELDERLRLAFRSDAFELWLYAVDLAKKLREPGDVPPDDITPGDMIAMDLF